MMSGLGRIVEKAECPHPGPGEAAGQDRPVFSREAEVIDKPVGVPGFTMAFSRKQELEQRAGEAMIGRRDDERRIITQIRHGNPG
jgi:hypothetical protein